MVSAETAAASANTETVLDAETDAASANTETVLVLAAETAAASANTETVLDTLCERSDIRDGAQVFELNIPEESGKQVAAVAGQAVMSAVECRLVETAEHSAGDSLYVPMVPELYIPDFQPVNQNFESFVQQQLLLADPQPALSIPTITSEHIGALSQDLIPPSLELVAPALDIPPAVSPLPPPPLLAPALQPAPLISPPSLY